MENNSRTDEKLDKIDEKLDKIHVRLGNIDSTLGAQHVSIVEHIRRTRLLEDQIRPIQKHVSMVEGAVKLIGLVSMVAVIVEAIHLVFK